MAQIETWLNQEMTQAVKVRYLDGNLFSMDNAGNLIGVILTKNGMDYSGGGTVSANVIRSDGNTVAVSGALSGNSATVVLPQAAYAVPGVVSIVVKLTANSEVTTIAAVVANVYESTTSTTVDPGTIIPSVQTLISQINTAVSSIPADYSSLWATLAPAFSTSTAYETGDYVTNGGVLYRFIADHAPGSWSASDATAANIGNDISEIKGALLLEDYSAISFNVANSGKFVNYNTGELQNSSGSVLSATDYINLSDYSEIKYKRNGTTATSPSTGIAFYDASKTYIIGYQAAKGQAETKYVDYLSVRTIPTGAVYGRFTVFTDVSTYGNFELYGKSIIRDNIGETVKNAEIGKLTDNIPIPFLTKGGNGIKASDGTEVSSDMNFSTDYVDLVGFSSITYLRVKTTSSTSTMGLAFYDQNKAYISGISGIPNASAYGYESTTVDIPQNAVYARFTYLRDTDTYGGFHVYGNSTLKKTLDELTSTNSVRSEAVALGLHTMPDNVGQLNVIKRARQMANIKWKPSFDINRAMVVSRERFDDPHDSTFRGLFKAGNYYYGIPYNNVSGKEYVGQETSIDAFATSVENAASIEGTDQNNNKYSHFGLACNSFTCHALNIPNMDTQYIPNAPGLSLVSELTASNAQNIQLADVIIETTLHSAVVTDIIKDNNGNITHVEVSDASRSGVANRSDTEGLYGGVCRRLMMTVEELCTMYAGFSIYRYQHLAEVPYVPNRYSPLQNEGNPVAYHNLPIMPYNGEWSSYAITNSTPTVSLLINSDYYDHVLVTKDGTAWNENGTTDMYSINSGDSTITISCPQEEALYTACLVKVSSGEVIEETVNCHWVTRPYLNPSVSISNNVATFSITVKSDRYKPWYVCFGSSNSNAQTRATTNGEYIQIFDDDLTVSEDANGITYSFSVAYPSSHNTNYVFAMISQGIGQSRVSKSVS